MPRLQLAIRDLKEGGGGGNALGFHSGFARFSYGFFRGLSEQQPPRGIISWRIEGWWMGIWLAFVEERVVYISFYSRISGESPLEETEDGGLPTTYMGARHADGGGVCFARANLVWPRFPCRRDRQRRGGQAFPAASNRHITHTHMAFRKAGCVPPRFWSVWWCTVLLGAMLARRRLCGHSLPSSLGRPEFVVSSLSLGQKHHVEFKSVFQPRGE